MIKSKVTFATCFTCMNSAKFLIFKFPKLMQQYTLLEMLESLFAAAKEFCKLINN